MSLVVEDGTGKPDAESYCSESDATAYHSLTDTNDTARDALITAWSGGAQPARESALREATRYLDGTYLERWVGYKAKKTQALAWPRLSAFDAYGYEIASTAIPTALKEATAELALRALTASILPDQEPGSGALTDKRVAAGSVSLSQSFSGGARERARFDRVELLLRPLLTGASDGVVELVRA